MRPRKIKRIAAGILVTTALTAGSVVTAAESRADTTEPGCVSQFWMIGLRATTRFICDGPIQPDGSWMRARAFYARAFTAAGYANCWGYGYCTFMPPREIPEYDKRDYYRVTLDTVLPDEPGHID
jgi:hypothetical protein